MVILFVRRTHLGHLNEAFVACGVGKGLKVLSFGPSPTVHVANNYENYVFRLRVSEKVWFGASK